MEGKIVSDFIFEKYKGDFLGLGIPEFPEDDFNRIYVVSDYKNSDKEIKVNNRLFQNICAFLILDRFEINDFFQNMIKFRKSIGLPENAFFDYKNIKISSGREGAIRVENELKFLEICDKIRGTLLVFFENERVISNKGLETLRSRIDHVGLGIWKPHILNQMINTFYYLNLIRLKLRSELKIFWLSHEDSRLGNNNTQLKNSLEIFKCISAPYGFKKGITIVSQKDAQQFYNDKDLRSIVDLACGRLFDYYKNSISKNKLDNGKIDQAEKYNQWFLKKSGNLKRRFIDLRLEGDKPKISVQ